MTSPAYVIETIAPCEVCHRGSLYAVKGPGYLENRGNTDMKTATGLIALLSALTATGPAMALVFDVTYDPSVATAPAGFIPAFADAIDFYQSTYTDPIVVNINVGWGEIFGTPVTALGESTSAQLTGLTYNQVRNALIADATSPADDIAVSTLPALDPTGGRSFQMSTGEAKALSLIPPSPMPDGFISFFAAPIWTFDPNDRAVPGVFDFIGVAEHEISEVMGRISEVGT